MKSNDQNSGSILNKCLLKSRDLEIDDTTIFKEEHLHQQVEQVFETGSLKFVSSSDKEMVLIEPYYPEPRLIILGGGHIAKPLVEFGTKVGFSVTVVDDRPSFANLNRFPEANQVICDSFENCFSRFNLNRSDFVVIVTRGHRHDGICLRQALKYNTAYIGMIGSKRRVRGMKSQLLGEGYAAEQLEHINAPIGLEIGAVTPEEIAVSIIAQVISFRRMNGSKYNGTNSSKFSWPDFDLSVLEEMSKEKPEAKAIITVISSKGSVPRKAGAKMIVWPDGRIMGSIGGGCSEAGIITVARDVILDGGYSIQHVDLTADVAAEEGMVCGGTMDVLIEAV